MHPHKYCIGTVRYCTLHTGTRRHTYKQSNPSPCTDSFAFGYFVLVLCALHHYVAEFLQWCVRKCTSALTRTLPKTVRVSYKFGTVTIRFCYLFKYSNSALLCPQPQHFRCNPERSSKAPSTHASNGPPKAIAPTVRMERSRNGTSRG